MGLLSCLLEESDSACMMFIIHSVTYNYNSVQLQLINHVVLHTYANVLSSTKGGSGGYTRVIGVRSRSPPEAKGIHMF